MKIHKTYARCSARLDMREMLHLIVLFKYSQNPSGIVCDAAGEGRNKTSGMEKTPAQMSIFSGDHQTNGIIIPETFFVLFFSYREPERQSNSQHRERYKSLHQLNQS